MDVIEGSKHGVVAGVDTHKDLHVAAVVDERDRVLETRSFATTRQGYRQMLVWMSSFGNLRRIGIESTGSYGAGLMRYMLEAGIEVMEVTTPDKNDRRRRGKNDDLDAQNAAHAAFARKRTVTPRSRDGMVESLRVLTVCRKTAVAARRVALQMIQTTIVSAPDALRDLLRSMTRMQLVRTLAAWRPDMTAYREVEAAYRISLKSLARRYLELHDEIADLDTMISAIVDDLAPQLVERNSIGYTGAAHLLLMPETIPSGCDLKQASRLSAVSVRCPPPRERRSVTGSTGAVTVPPIAPFTSSPSGDSEPIQRQRPMSPDASPRGIPNSMPSGSSSDTSLARSST